MHSLEEQTTKLAWVKTTLASLEAHLPLSDGDYEELCHIDLLIINLKTVIRFRKEHEVKDITNETPRTS